METEKIIAISISGASLIWAVRNRLLDYSVARLYYLIRNPREDEYELLLFSKSKKIIKYSELGKTVGLQLYFPSNTEITSIRKELESNKNINLSFEDQNNIIVIKFDYLKRNMFASLNISTKGQKNEILTVEVDFINSNKIVKYHRHTYLFHRFGRVLPISILFIVPLFQALEYFDTSRLTTIFLCFCYGFFIFDLFGWFRKTKLDKVLDKKAKNSHG